MRELEEETNATMNARLLLQQPTGAKSAIYGGKGVELGDTVDTEDESLEDADEGDADEYSDDE
jgi:hypothetical protein